MKEAKDMRFESALDKALGENTGNGIGTLGEKTLHSFLKYYLEENTTNHEVKTGRFVADIKNSDGITEIQTRSFNAMRKKLDFFLKDNTVTVVHPLAAIKNMCWINTQSGETTKTRKSPKKASVHDAFSELYKIKGFLLNPNLRFRFMLLELTEYRNLDGWSDDGKKGSTRYDRIPSAVLGEVILNSPEDYKSILPAGLPSPFTSSDYAKCAKITVYRARTALNVLKYVGAVKEAGKDGRKILYTVN